MMICLTTSVGAFRSIRRLWMRISYMSQVLEPSPQGVLRVVTYPPFSLACIHLLPPPANTPKAVIDGKRSQKAGVARSSAAEVNRCRQLKGSQSKNIFGRMFLFLVSILFSGGTQPTRNVFVGSLTGPFTRRFLDFARSRSSEQTFSSDCTFRLVKVIRIL